MPIATTITQRHIATVLGIEISSLSPAKLEQWAMWIDDAVMLINDRIDTLSFAGTIDQAKIDYVVREAVSSHVQRPDDATQVSVSVDDGSVSRTYRSGSGRVAIADEWWLLLGLTPSSGAFSIDTIPAAASFHLDTCSLVFGAPCSCGGDLAGHPLWGV